MKLAQIFSCFTFYDVTTPIFYTVDNQLITIALALLQNLTTDLVSGCMFINMQLQMIHQPGGTKYKYKCLIRPLATLLPFPCRILFRK